MFSWAYLSLHALYLHLARMFDRSCENKEYDNMLSSYWFSLYCLYTHTYPLPTPSCDKKGHIGLFTHQGKRRS